MVDAVRFRLRPTAPHKGLLLPAVGKAGVACTTTATVPAADVQPFMVAVTLYVPLAATVTFGIVGFAIPLVNPLGPVHENVTIPGVAVAADNDNVLPAQLGALLLIVGVAGAEGSTRVKGPTWFDGQPFSTTKIFVYVPAERLGIIRAPAAPEVKLTVTDTVFFI